MPTIVANRDVSFDLQKNCSTTCVRITLTRAFFWPLSMLPMFENKPENEVDYSLYNAQLISCHNIAKMK